MKHIALVIAGLILLAFAGIVIWPNRHALTMMHLVFAGACIAVAYALALGADFKTACNDAASIIPAVRSACSHTGDK